MGPIVLIVFFSGLHGDGGLLPALVHALHESLGPQVQVTLRRSPSPPTDEAVDQERRAGGVTAAARVGCVDRECLRAAVYLSIAGEPHGREQLVTFIPSDPIAQRGRALGVVIAYHLIDVSRAGVPTGSAAKSGSAAIEASPTLSGTLPPAEDRNHTLSVEAFATVGLPIAGPGRGFGGGVALRWPADRPWAARLGLRLRGGEIAAAQATYSGWALSAGVGRILAGDARTMRPAVALRLEALLLYEVFTHFSSDDPVPVREGRFLPGAAALLELQWRLGTSAALLVSAGAEAAAGATEVLVRHAKVAEVSAWRAVGEAGFRTHF